MRYAYLVSAWQLACVGGLAAQKAPQPNMALCACASDPAAGTSTTETYRGAGGEHTFTRTVRVGSDCVHVVTHAVDQTTRNQCGTDGQSKRWSMESDPAIKVTAVRDDHSINVTVRRGQAVDQQRMDLKGLPWLQALSYALSPNLRDLRRPLVFRMLRPDTLSAITLRALDDGLELLTIGGRQIRARRIKVSPAQRLVGALVHSVYWFRETDGLFVRFEGPAGLPGIETHIVEWVPSERSNK